MSTSFVIFIVIHLIALLYFVELLRRVYVRCREFNLKDTSSTLPFSFIRLRHIIILYVICYLAWVLVSIFLYFTLISPSPSAGTATLQDFNLNW